MGYLRPMGPHYPCKPTSMFPKTKTRIHDQTCFGEHLHQNFKMRTVLECPDRTLAKSPESLCGSQKRNKAGRGGPGSWAGPYLASPFVHREPQVSQPLLTGGETEAQEVTAQVLAKLGAYSGP